jgi:hypothetical protein
MSEIRNLGVSVEEYLDGLAAGIHILELKRLEARSIPTNLALEVMAITPKVINGTATQPRDCPRTNDFDHTRQQIE